MRNIYFALILLSATVVLFGSCDTSAENSIIGEWRVEKLLVSATEIYVAEKDSFEYRVQFLVMITLR